MSRGRTFGMKMLLIPAEGQRLDVVDSLHPAEDRIAVQGDAGHPGGEEREGFL